MPPGDGLSSGVDLLARGPARIERGRRVLGRVESAGVHAGRRRVPEIHDGVDARARLTLAGSDVAGRVDAEDLAFGAHGFQKIVLGLELDGLDAETRHDIAEHPLTLESVREHLRRAEEGRAGREASHHGERHQKLSAFRGIRADGRVGGTVVLTDQRQNDLRVRGIHVHGTLPPDADDAAIRIVGIRIHEGRPKVLAHAADAPELFEAVERRVLPLVRTGEQVVKGVLGRRGLRRFRADVADGAWS